MTRVANPIYDVVFKYLLEDKKIAKLLISGILELEVLDLDFKPQEYSLNLRERVLTVFRIDFKARIRLRSGEERIVLIELQKAKYSTDIMRFRRYLGGQYSLSSNSYIDSDGNRRALPIITIYFLGYPLEHYKDVPIIRVSRHYIDQSTGAELEGKKEGFIEALTHDSVIIQVQAIKHKKRRTRLEEALSVFEQGKVHEVNVDESSYPEEYKPLIRRLLKAVSDEEIRETMNVEDELLEELTAKERLAAKLQKEKEEAERKAEEEKRKAEEEKRKAEEEKRKAEAERQMAEARLKNLYESAKLMKKMGISTEEIERATGLSSEEIEKL